MRRVIVDKAVYEDGTRRDITGDIGDALDLARRGAGAFVWIGLFEPEEAEFDLVKEEFDLHPLAAEDAVRPHQRPKMERYGDTLFIVLKTLTYIEETSDIEVGEIMLFLGRGFVLTVRHGAGNPLGPVRQRLENSPELLQHGATAVMYAVCDEVVDHYERVNEEVEADVIGLEHAVFDPEAREVTSDIYSLKREVLEFRSAEDPLIPVLDRIVRGRVRECRSTREYFRDVLDHLMRVDEKVDAHDELLNSVLTAHLALVGKRQNEDMRKISAWAAIIAVPTAIAGIYGMNFEHIPELHWTFGYPLALVVMAVVCVLLFRKFRRSGWL